MHLFYATMQVKVFRAKRDLEQKEFINTGRKCENLNVINKREKETIIYILFSPHLSGDKKLGPLED